MPENRSLAVLRDLHEVYTTVARAITRFSADSMSSLLVPIDCTFNALRSNDLSADYIPKTLNSSYFNDRPSSNFSPADHEHSDYLKDTTMTTASGLLYGGEYIYGHDLALQDHVHDDIYTLGSTVRLATNLGGHPIAFYAAAGHTHLDRYHTRHVDRAYTISGISYIDLAKADHSHGYTYYFNSDLDPVLNAAAFKHLNTIITPSDLADAEHTHDDRYFTVEQSEAELLFKGDPISETRLLALHKYEVNVGSISASIQKGNTNFTRLGLPGYNTEITSNAYVDLGTVTADPSGNSYISMEYIDLFVYPGSYVVISLESEHHTIRGVFPASYGFELENKGRGIQEMMYCTWDDTSFGVYVYDFNDIVENPYIRLLLLYEVDEDYLETSPGYIYPAHYGQLNPDDMVGDEISERFAVVEGRFYMAVPPSSVGVVSATVEISVGS